MGINEYNYNFNDDEFYTQEKNIVYELSHYSNEFNGATIYLPCDPPHESKFFKYFKDNFSSLGISRLYATFFSDRPYVTFYDGISMRTEPIRSGRFQDNAELMKDCDIVVTNPPYSDGQARQFLEMVIDLGKDFIMVAPSSLLRKPEIFSMLKSGEINVGYSSIGRFTRPVGPKQKSSTVWLTSFPVDKPDFNTENEFDEVKHRKYDNYDAIDCGTKDFNTTYKDIPNGYEGNIGVTHSFLRKLNRNQYELVDILDKPMVNGKALDTRFIIRLKQPGVSEAKIYTKKQLNEMKRVLLEGSRDKALSVFLPLFQKRGIEMSQSQLKQDLLRKFVSEAGMHNLSLGGNYYLCGVARYYFNGDLTSNTRLGLLYPNVKDKFDTEICKRLDVIIGILRNAYIDTVGTQWEQPEDFGKLSLNALLKKYNKKVNKELGIDTKKPDEKPSEVFSHKAGKKYTYDILYGYDDAKKYNRYTEPGAWCITYAQNHFNSYVNRLGIHYVVFKVDGFENVKREVGKGYTKQKPHDAYGNSLICVLQSNTSPEPVYITSRWNHGSSFDNTYGTEADHAYTKEEFLNVIGDDGTVLDTCFREWKENKGKPRSNGSEKAKRTIKLKSDALRAMKYAQMLISNGKDPNEVFTYIYPFNTTGKDGMDTDAIIKRGLCIVCLKLENGEEVWSFMDNRKVLYDVNISLRNNEDALPYRNSLIRFDEKRGDFLKFNVFKRNDWFYCLYSMSKRKFLEVEGNYIFSAVPYSLMGDDETNKKNDIGRFFIVAVSNNQYALIDTDTLQPVKARNGSPWFEYIGRDRYHYSRGRDYSTITLKSEEVIIMIYDSSANEIYRFDCKNGRFVENTTEVGGIEYHYSDFTDVLVIDGKRYCPYVGNNHNIFKSPDDGEILHLGPYWQFTGINTYETKHFIVFKTSSDISGLYPNYHVYIRKTGKLLTKDGSDTFPAIHVLYMENLFPTSENKDVKRWARVRVNGMDNNLAWVYDTDNERFLEINGCDLFRCRLGNDKFWYVQPENVIDRWYRLYDIWDTSSSLDIMRLGLY